MTKYRIRIYNTEGLELMNRPFEDSAMWNKYWDDIQKKESLLGFAGQGLLILSKDLTYPFFRIMSFHRSLELMIRELISVSILWVVFADCRNLKKE